MAEPVPDHAVGSVRRRAPQVSRYSAGAAKAYASGLRHDGADAPTEFVAGRTSPNPADHWIPVPEAARPSVARGDASRLHHPSSFSGPRRRHSRRRSLHQSPPAMRTVAGPGRTPLRTGTIGRGIRAGAPGNSWLRPPAAAKGLTAAPSTTGKASREAARPLGASGAWSRRVGTSASSAIGTVSASCSVLFRNHSQRARVSERARGPHWTVDAEKSRL